MRELSLKKLWLWGILSAIIVPFFSTIPIIGYLCYKSFRKNPKFVTANLVINGLFSVLILVATFIFLHNVHDESALIIIYIAPLMVLLLIDALIIFTYSLRRKILIVYYASTRLILFYVLSFSLLSIFINDPGQVFLVSVFFLLLLSALAIKPLRTIWQKAKELQTSPPL